MRISVSAGYWSAGPPPGAADLFEAAERIGIDQIWTAEAYGSDAWTPLAWWGSRTSRIKLGTAVSQLSARPPVTLAMTAMTMDHLTQGRVLLGIGTSNPQVVEGWYGEPYPRPLERTREYIDIVRQVIARREPVSYDGKHYQLPLSPTAGAPAWASRCARSCTRTAPRSRSTWARRDRRTWPWRPRSPTAGTSSSSRPR
jgi:Coenzyme F420-dependent N5,N10-methylene tetrahydromethanopterin reductase and related flavin-dependent oxidoreductases